MRPWVRRVLPRIFLLALVGGLFLPLGLALGQAGDVPSNPAGQVDVPSNSSGQEPREEELEAAESPATAPESEEGLQPASNDSQPTTADIISLKVRTSECADGQGSETRLGIMKNSAANSYCP